jgi:hypothetical protein
MPRNVLGSIGTLGSFGVPSARRFSADENGLAANCRKPQQEPFLPRAIYFCNAIPRPWKSTHARSGFTREILRPRIESSGVETDRARRSLASFRRLSRDAATERTEPTKGGMRFGSPQRDYEKYERRGVVRPNANCGDCSVLVTKFIIPFYRRSLIARIMIQKMAAAKAILMIG